MKENKDLDNIIGKRDTAELIRKIHLAILSLDKRIIFRVFPIYIRYSKDDKVIAVLYLKGKYLKGKFVNSRKIILGLNLNKKPKLLGFEKIEYVLDINIKYTYIINDSTKFNNSILKVIKLIEL
jgi:hypothetical protein